MAAKALNAGCFQNKGVVFFFTPLAAKKKREDNYLH
jgi:hypothetical protein